MHQWSIFIFFQDLLLQIRLNLETSRSKRVKVPTTNQFLKHAPRANTSNTVCIYHKFFFIKNSLCYLPLVHIWQSWTFKASLLRYMPIIHHFCLKVFTFANIHVFPYMTIKFIYSRNIQTLYNAIWNTGALINV